MAHTIAAEFGKLKRVLMHRPGRSFDYVTEKTLTEYNFTAVPNLELFLEHYDQMTSAIAERDAEVLLLTDVLQGNAEALKYIDMRPNLVYTRDLAVMTPAGAILMGMMLKSRQGDTWVIRAALEKLGVPILGEIAEPGWLEGGGVTFIDDRTCVASICDRTNHWGTKQFCDLLFSSGAAEEIVLVPMTAGAVHIDGVFMTVGPQVALIHAESFNVNPARILRKDQPIRYVNFVDFLTDRGFTLLHLTEKECARAALNIITTEPFQGVGFDTGARLYKELEKFGGNYTGIPSAELFKGCGGAHCLTCPIERV